nr:OB-fold domain-containing protein [Oceanobacillus saliphilus]
MSVEAAIDCLQGFNAEQIDSVFFATTTGPYTEKSSIPTISKALDLRAGVKGIEAAQSLRAGSSSLLVALDQEGTTLVLASDHQLSGPGGTNEQLFGDGAVSFIVGTGEDVIAKVVDTTSVQVEIIKQWRNEGDPFVQNWEDRFASSVYTTKIYESVLEFLDNNNLSISDISKVAISAPGTKGYLKIAKSLGVSKEQIQDPLFDQVGQTGSSHSGLMLISALEEAKPGDTILVVNFAEGTDIMLYQVTDSIAKLSKRRGVRDYIEVKNNELSYADYLKWKEIIKMEPPRRPAKERPSAPALYRNYDQNLGFYGSKCQVCNTPQFPKQRVCVECQTKDKMEDYRFFGRTAEIVTFTLDYLAPTPASPALVAVIDFEGGGRIISEVTDCDPAEIKIGMDVELTFRRLYEAGGIHNYFWKVRPKR